MDHRSTVFDTISLDVLTFDARYKLFAGAVIPRPIALVTTLNPTGSVNIAPFSSFMIASVEAGYLAFSIGPSQGPPKTTLRNVRRNKEFVINCVTESLARQVQLCGEFEPTGQGQSKLDRAGFTTLGSKSIQTPRIAQCKIHFECILHRLVRFGQSHLVVGEVRALHATRGLIENGKIDPLALAPLGRIAGRHYCAIKDIISV